jgi:alanine racemase
MQPTWAEIDLSALSHNLKNIRKKAEGRKILFAVKANGYGHGAIEISKRALNSGVDMLGVATPEEAFELREAGIEAPILILGSILPGEAGEVIRKDIRQTVCDLELARKLSQEAGRQTKKAIIHIKIDTGMGRIGVSPQKSVSFIKEVLRLNNLEIEGIFTHFPSAGEKDKSFTLFQLEQFLKITEELKREGINISLKHTANSAAILDLPQTYLDMLRPGLIVYGLFPSPYVSRNIDLKAVMSLKTRIVFLKKVPGGTGIGYGRTYVTKKNSLIATLSVGYADGYSRLLSNQGEVIIKGKKVPVVGRICMDQCMVEIENIPEVKIGEEVVLIGRQGKEEIKAGEIAKKLGTIPHEIVSRIGKRVPRIYVN